MSAAAEQDVIQKFVARNGSAWGPTSAKPAPVVGGWMTVATVRMGERTDAPGVAVPLTKAQAQATAIAFLKLNWDLIGFRSAAGAAALSASMDLNDGDPGGFHLQFDSKETQPGYEHIKGSENKLRLRVQIGADGKVRSFAELLPVSPLLTMAPYPTMSEADYRASLNGVTIGDTGVKITPTDTVNFNTFLVLPFLNGGGQTLFLKFWMSANGRTYFWQLNSCTLKINSWGTIGGG